MARIPVWRRYARLFGADVKADVRDELEFHLEAKVDELVAQGWQREAARREAERQFGNFQAVEQTGARLGDERERTQRRRDFLGACAQDLRYALRGMRRDIGFTAITVAILALGIGANTAVFSVVNTVLLRPLPFRDSEQLAWLASGRDLARPMREAAGLSGITYTVAAFEEFQRRNRSFQSVTSYNPFYGNSEFTLTGRFEPQPVAGVMVAGNFFQTLGVEPVLGRLFTPEECQKGGRPAALLSYPFWKRQFAADPRIVGQTITVSKQLVTVVGVLPPGFDFGSVFSPGMNFDLFVPAVMDEMRNWGNTLALVGRLKPGITVAQAQAEADVLFPQIQRAHPEWWGDYVSTISGLKEYVSGKLRRSLIVLWGAVGLIMLMVCVNLSNLLLARATARSKEFAMRRALGAGPERLFRQLLTESLALSAAGALAGLVLAFALTRYLAHQGSIALPLLTSVAVDRAALLWTFLVTAAATVLIALVPAIRISGGNLHEALQDTGHGMSAGRKHERLRGVLVISEVALACVLLVGAGLLLRSFLRVLDVDLGFRPAQAAVIRIDYDGSNAEKRGVILEDMLSRVKAIPGVETAGVADMLPLGRNRSWGLSAKGYSYPKDEVLTAMVRIVTPGYLAAMGMRLRDGRDFTWQDTAKSKPVVIINEAAERRFWRGDKALGRFANLGREGARVIGVLADVRQRDVEVTAGPEMYLSVTQAEPEGAELVIRTRLAPEALASAVMKTLRAWNPAQPATELRPLQRIVDQAVSPRRFFVVLVGSFAGLGLVLASLGIYGVISYTVARRTQEIGIRMALGATAGQVQRGVMGGAVRLVLAGMGLGLAVSIGVVRAIESLLFGTAPTDPATFAAILALLTAVACAAGYVPAWRASRIQPMSALRSN